MQWRQNQLWPQVGAAWREGRGVPPVLTSSGVKVRRPDYFLFVCLCIKCVKCQTLEAHNALKTSSPKSGKLYK